MIPAEAMAYVWRERSQPISTSPRTIETTTYQRESEHPCGNQDVSMNGLHVNAHDAYRFL